MKLNRFFAVLAVVLLVAVSGFAQTTANLTGTVTNGGAPLPGATVTISSPALQGTRTAVTDVNGNYNFGGVPPGDYTVRFELESMTPATRTVRVGLAQTARADADLKLSTTVAEAITVTASSPAVLETTEVQTNINAKLIEDLPIGRTLLATVSLAPGTNTNGPGGNTVISGAPSYDNLYLIDGAVANENLRGQPHDLYIEDAIQETTILTGAISAEYGRFSGGVVTAISKSGGNQYSGTLRDSLQKPRWTANSPVAPPLRNSATNQTYEGTLGGRIIRDRLWFFAAGRYFDTNSGAGGWAGSDPVTGAAIPGQPLFVAGRTQKREELKLTGQITDKHSITVTGLNISDEQTNNAFPAAGNIFENSALDTSRETPNSFKSAHYNGVITNSFLLEANGTEKHFAFKGSGGDAVGDFANGSNVEDFSKSPTAFLGAPTFCGACSEEDRDNRNWSVKGTYYLSTKSAGTHNIVTGYDDWHQSLRSDNHQSASDFTIIDYSPGITRNSAGNAIWNLAPSNGDAAIIIWWPILQSSLGNDLATRSFFVNDKWDFNNKLSFNLGGRYDKNIGKDSAHNTIANDSKVSPRLGVIYDVTGNGRIRLNASYSQYVSAIADGNVADAGSPAGQPSYLYWLYYGPDIANQTTPQALTTMYNWFKSIGYTANRDPGIFLGGKSNGIGSIIPEPLSSPYVTEYTIGAGSQIGSRGFLRADVIHRNWKNFYTTQTNLSNGKVFDPLSNQNTDLTYEIVTNDFKREYNALQLQGSYTPLTRVNIGANYTYSRLRGNHGAETSGSGPVSSSGATDYPEYLSYANRNPIGFMSADERNKVRAWVSYDQPTPIGTFNFSLLENYDSGQPYGALGTIDPTRRPAAAFDPAHPSTTSVTVANPGYVQPPTTGNYYFSARDAYRTDNISSTNVAVNWNLPPLLGKAQFYVETELRNAFNRQGVVSPNQTVNSNKTSSATFRSFNPFTDTPIECPQGASAATCKAMGANWQKGVNFGKATSGTSYSQGGSFQLPRTFLLSAGVKF